jgi:diguanylate cyclase (GGDEF)-like protein
MGRDAHSNAADRAYCHRMITSKESARANHKHPCATDASILLVDDDPGAMQLLSSILSGEGHIRFATNGTDAMRLARTHHPDIILLDAEMPGMSGFKVLEALKAESGLADVPVVFITSHGEAGFEVSALEMGAVDYIGKPFKSSIVLARVKTHLSQKRKADGLRRDSMTDSLTGIASSRYFDQALAREWLIARRAGEPMSLLIIDVDRFQAYNDRYGHPKGDACLRRLAQVLLGEARLPADLVARCGGEEFVVLLPKTSRQGAEHVARRVLDAVEASGLFHRDSGAPSQHLTVSIGIGCHDAESPCWPNTAADLQEAVGGLPGRDDSDLVFAADRALHCAQRGGGARAVLRDISDVDSLELEIAASPPRATPH